MIQEDLGAFLPGGSLSDRNDEVDDTWRTVGAEARAVAGEAVGLHLQFRAGPDQTGPALDRHRSSCSRLLEPS